MKSAPEPLSLALPSNPQGLNYFQVGRAVVPQKRFTKATGQRAPTSSKAKQLKIYVPGSPGHVTRDDQRSYVKIEALLGSDATDIHESLRKACGSGAVQRSTVCYWASVFREGDCEWPSDQPSYGRQGSSTTYSLRM